MTHLRYYERTLFRNYLGNFLHDRRVCRRESVTAPVKNVARLGPVSLVGHKRVDMDDNSVAVAHAPADPLTDLPATTCFALVEFQPRHAWGLYVQATGGLLFRVTPNRDPDQPRLWCLRFDRCISVGAVQPDGYGCLAGSRIAWGDLTAVFTAIRSDVEVWLSQPTQRDLHRWLVEATRTRPDRVIVGRTTGSAGMSFSVIQEEEHAPEAPIPPSDGTSTTSNAIYG